MNVEVPHNASIKFRDIHFSDLNSVISIYKKKTQESVTDKLTARFGLPSSIAIDNNEIIGFASASLNETDEIKVDTYIVKTVGNLYVENMLKQHAEKALYSRFGDFEKDNISLKSSIHQLVVWLNKY
ncbi:hypothetical protein [Pedobacter antarcticus]|uniref:hypothetical protein n=1 Tax=Pedobacter antarcticus TaxID=34086 RepID=UPI00292DBAB5|nr:hypothetical protein [Pedobacter antarcticus]